MVYVVDVVTLMGGATRHQGRLSLGQALDSCVICRHFHPFVGLKQFLSVASDPVHVLPLDTHIPYVRLISVRNFSIQTVYRFCCQSAKFKIVDHLGDRVPSDWAILSLYGAKTA